MSDTRRVELPVTITSGPVDWQVLQQDKHGKVTVRLRGHWRTLIRRKRPDVRIRVAREGSFDSVGKAYDWAVARTQVDRTIKGDAAGMSGSWSLTLKDLPCGGPYRIDTTVGSVEDGNEWRRAGQTVHFVCVGDVWLIAGQSNAEGYGRDPVDDPPELGIHQYNEDGWGLASHGRFHHPWLMFAKALKRELGYPIGLVPTAVGGSAVSLWDPGQKGALFAAMRTRVLGAGGRLGGCVWYQGESDTGSADYPLYKTRFTRFVKGLRRLVKDPALPLITVQLNRVLGARDDGAGWDAIREIQRQLAHELTHVFVFPVFEAGLCDNIHTGSLGNLLIAQRAARTALGGVYGQDIAFRHPECMAVKRLSSRRLELRFAQVVERLDYANALVNGFPFAVRDDRGEVPVTGYTHPGRDRMRLELGRPLVGKASVTGAPGCCPPQMVPRDISGYRGMLAFTLREE